MAAACQGTAAARAASTRPTVQQEYGPVMKLPDRGKPEHSRRHLTHHQTPHGLPWETTRASMVGSRRELLYVATNHRSTLHIANCARYSALLMSLLHNARNVTVHAVEAHGAAAVWLHPFLPLSLCGTIQLHVPAALPRQEQKPSVSTELGADRS